MIQSFRGDAEAIFNGKSLKGWSPELLRGARRKLLMLHAATSLEDLAVPPGNRLEALAGDRAGQHSIRINQQWRVCFVWKDGHAFQVEVVDYH